MFNSNKNPLNLSMNNSNIPLVVTKKYGVVKVVRTDCDDFWGSFLMGVTEELQKRRGFSKEDITTMLRTPGGKELPFKVTEKGVININESNYSRYTQEEKKGFSKKQSTTLIKISSNGQDVEFAPPVFGWGKRDGLVGVLFFCNDIENDPNFKVDMIMRYDGGTFGRPNRFADEVDAKAFAEEKIFNKDTNPEGIIFNSYQELFEHGNEKQYNEVLMRMKWTPNDQNCNIGIFEDSLKSRIMAQFRAADAKINLDANYVPICFYLSEKKKLWSILVKNKKKI